MAIKSDNTQGNPYHDEGTGQFTSSTGGGQSNKEDLVKESDLGSLFASADEDFSDFWNEVDSTIKEKESQPKSIDDMSTQELLNGINETEERLKSKYVIVCDQGFTEVFNHDLKLTYANLQKMNELFSKYNMSAEEMLFYKDPKHKSVATVAYIMDPTLSDDSVLFSVNTKLILNPAYFNSYDSTKEYVKKRIEEGFFSDVLEGNFSCRTIIHESGHILFNSIFIQDLRSDYLNAQINDMKTEAYLPVNSYETYEEKNKFASNIRKQYAEKYRKEIYNIYKSDNPNALNYIDFCRSISGYGGSNSFEWFSEVFTQANGGKPTQISNAMEKFLKMKGAIKQ